MNAEIPLSVRVGHPLLIEGDFGESFYEVWDEGSVPPEMLGLKHFSFKVIRESWDHSTEPPTRTILEAEIVP